MADSKNKSAERLLGRFIMLPPKNHKWWWKFCAKQGSESAA